MADDVPPAGDAQPEGVKLSLPQAVAALLADLPGLLSDRVQLLSLELRRARQALAQIVALVLMAAILAGTAWLALWVGIVAALVRAGLAWPLACLLVVMLNLAAAVWAAMRVKALAPLLALPATLRRLTHSDGREDDAADPLARMTSPPGGGASGNAP